uniref:Uncharacterized protein n=1 Tax=Cyanothece sp. (strain PCC 7425 / ATCC 29141) TaxID=395961 RepID=B8HQT6_CYAP4
MNVFQSIPLSAETQAVMLQVLGGGGSLSLSVSVQG